MTVELRGLIPPLCTPLTPEGAVDVDSLRSLVEFQLNAGASGVFVLGSSGEAIYLDDADRLLVATEAARAVAGRVPLLVGRSPRRRRAWPSSARCSPGRNRMPSW